MPEVEGIQIFTDSDPLSIIRIKASFNAVSFFASHSEEEKKRLPRQREVLGFIVSYHSRLNNVQAEDRDGVGFS